MYGDDIKIKFGIHKGKLAKDVPDSWYKFVIEKNILKGKLLSYGKKRLNYPKNTYQVTIEDSIGTDGEYIVEAYTSNDAIKICQKKYKIQNTQSYHGTSYSAKCINKIN